MTARRTFLAIDISDAARNACRSHIDALRTSFPKVRIGWERAEKIHITLKFLGATESLGRLQTGLHEIAREHERFTLRLSVPGVFPSKTRPRILWIGVEDNSGTLSALQRRVESLCHSLGFAKDDRPYRPHLTIGRVREPQNAFRLAEEHCRMQIEPVEFEVADIVIYESKLQPTGSVYSVISRLSLTS